MIRIVLVDDHTLVRTAVRKFLEAETNFVVVGEADSGEQALPMVRELRPDVVVMDVLMPGMGGLEATQRICRGSGGPAVVALSGAAEQPFPAQMLKAGACGYVTKAATSQELIEAIKKAFVGKRYVCHDVAQELASYAFEDNLDNPFETLSHREMQIMMMVVNCQRVSEISNSLHLSPKTVNSYRYRIFDKLNVHSDVELALLAVKHGIVQSLNHGARRAGKHEASAAVSVA